MSSFKRFRDAAICVALLAIPFFFLNANIKDPEHTNAFDRTVLTISSPIQLAATSTARWFSGIWQDYIYLVDVKEENDRLRSENGRLTEENRRLRYEALENRRLRSLLQLRERIGGELIGAQVIGRDYSPFFRVTRIRLDRSDRERVRPGMPVITAEGLVGQIRRSFARYSDVLLTVDRDSAIDVVVQRTGARGMIRGTGEDDRYVAQIQYLRREDQIRVGDLVHNLGTRTTLSRVDPRRASDADRAPRVRASPARGGHAGGEFLEPRRGPCAHRGLARTEPDATDRTGRARARGARGVRR